MSLSTLIKKSAIKQLVTVLRHFYYKLGSWLILFVFIDGVIDIFGDIFGCFFNLINHFDCFFL